MSFKPRLLLGVLTVVFFSACSRQTARPALERVAVLRFENLGADPADDWIGRALSEMIAAGLQGAPGMASISRSQLRAVDVALGARPVAAPGISAERTAAVAAGATRLAYGQYRIRNGILEASLTIEDTVDRKVVGMTPVSAPVADLATAASTLAAQISPHTKPYQTNNALVIRAYVEALEGVDRPGVAENLEKALAVEPDFGPIYLQLAEWKMQQKDLDGAIAVLNKGLARGNAVADRDRARLQLELAILRNNPAARLDALAALAKADPEDPQNVHELATVATALHRYPQAVDAFRKYLAGQPQDFEAWNQFGYAAAYAGDSATATSAIATYRKLQPAAPNALDSLGDVQLILGHPAEAEAAYLETVKKDPNFLGGLDLVKAAMAHLTTGDIPGADALAKQYRDARTAAKDPLVDYRQAQWSWLSGRRKGAVDALQKVAHDAEAANQREVAAGAYSELAMWNLLLGRRDTATQAVQKAVSLATPSTASTALLTRFLSQPPASATEWETRATQLAPNPAQASIRNMALAYAQLLSKNFPAAATLLHTMYDSGNTVDGLPVLLAWADLETGHTDEAAALLRANQPLADTGPSWTTSMYFPRIFYLRGVAAQKQSKSADAAANFHLFLALSGPDPLLWGEEQKAK